MARGDVTYSRRRSTADITGICVHVTNTAAVAVFLQNSACNCTEELYSVHAITIPGRHSQGSPFPVYTIPKVSNLKPNPKLNPKLNPNPNHSGE